MAMRHMRKAALGIMLGLGTMVFQSCPFNGVFNDCFGEDTISEAEYEDLNFLEQLGYEENDCGRYEPTSNFLGDLFD
jgi:hypothetical protein